MTMPRPPIQTNVPLGATIPPHLLRRLTQHAITHPNETCGLVFGHHRHIPQIHELHLVDNIHPKPRHHYRMDPDQQIGLYRYADNIDIDIVAVWHTHPSLAGPRPSPADIENAHDPRILHLITGFTATGATTKLWYIDNEHNQLLEIPLMEAP